MKKTFFFFFFLMLVLSVNIMFSSCSNKKSAIDGYEWLEGKWVTEDRYSDDYFYNCVIVGKDYFQYASELEDGEVITDVASRPKNKIEIKMYFVRELQSDEKVFYIYHIDEGKKQIYWLYDFDQKIYMKKIE